MLFFGIVWSLVCLVFDGVSLHLLLKQWAAGSHAVAAGQIVSSGVISRTDENGESYAAEFVYTYAVGGKQYQGRLERYGAIQFFQQASRAAAEAKKLPAGTAVSIYYNPKDPQDAILYPGADGKDYMFFFILMPFNALMLHLWGSGARALQRAISKRTAGGVPVVRTPLEVRLRLVYISPLSYGLIASTGVWFPLLIFVWILGTADGGPVLTANVMTLAAGLAVGLWRWQKNRAGEFDLILNEKEGFLELPAGSGRDRRTTIRQKDVKAVGVEVKEQSEGSEDSHVTCSVGLRLSRASRWEIVCDWLNREESAELADWLCEQLHVPREPDLGAGGATVQAPAV